MAAPMFPTNGFSSNQRSDFDDTGYLILRQVFTKSEIDALRAAADRAAARWKQREKTTGSSHPHLDRVEPLLEYDDSFVPLISDSRFFSLLCDILGSGIALLDSAYFISPPTGTWGDTSDWHIDEGLMGPSGAPIPLMVKVSIPLVSILSIKDGATAVIPGSHRRSFDENLPNPDGDPADMPGLIPIEVAAGDLYIFHGRIHHAAMPNRGTQTRRMLQLNYGHIWMKPWPGHEPSERVKRLANTPELRQLLHVSDHPYQHRIDLP